MVEVGTEATAGRFGSIVNGFGRVAASGEMGVMLTNLGNMMAAGRLTSTINAIADLVASGQVNATVEPVIQSVQNINFNALDLSQFSSAVTSLEDTASELSRLQRAGVFAPILRAVDTIGNSEEMISTLRAFTDFGEVEGLRSVPDINKPAVKAAFNTIVRAVGRLIASAPVRDLTTAAGSMLVSNRLRTTITTFGAALSGDLANAMPQDAADVIKPVVDAAIKALGAAINTGKLDGPMQAMRTISRTREFGAVKTAAQAMQKMRAYTDLMTAMRAMRTSGNLVTTTKLAEDVAGTHETRIIDTPPTTVSADVPLRVTRVRRIGLLGATLDLSGPVQSIDKQAVRIHCYLCASNHCAHCCRALARQCARLMVRWTCRANGPKPSWSCPLWSP